MKFFKRILGICETPRPADAGAWSVDGHTARVDLSRLPELKSPGSGVRLEGNGLRTRLLVFHGDDGQYHAVINRCTHMGRRLDTIAGSSVIQCCSVSKSTYTYDGTPVGGAAKTPLTTCPVVQENQLLTIALNT